MSDANKIHQLIGKHTDRELVKSKNDLAAAVKRIASLEAEIVAQKKPIPTQEEAKSPVSQQSEAVRIHSERAREAIKNYEAARREVILLKREIDDLKRQLVAKQTQIDEIIADVQTESAIDRPAHTPVSVPTKLRRSRRS